MKTSSLPNLNRETISFPTFFSLIQDPDHHDDTTLNNRPKIDNSQYTEASDTSPLKVASAHVNNNDNNNNNNDDHRALDAASALMDDAQSCCGSNSYGGDMEECSSGSSPRSGYSVSNDGNTSTSRIGSGSWVHQSFGPNRVPHSFPSLATVTEGIDSRPPQVVPCLVGREFNFFHTPSLSAVEVKVMEPSPVANSLALPNTEVLPEICLSTHDEDGLLVGVPVSPSSRLMVFCYSCA